MTEPRNVRIVIDEMLDHIEYTKTKMGRLSATEFSADRDTRLIIERALEIISEASRHLPAEMKRLRTDIPWQQIANLGNVLRHTYHAVSSKIIWDIVHEHLTL